MRGAMLRALFLAVVAAASVRAEDERLVVWYAGTHALHPALAAAFMAAHPKIRVELIQLGGPSLTARFTADEERGVHAADAFSTGLTESYPGLRARGWLADLRSLPHWGELPAWAKDPRGTYAFFHVLRHCLAVNTELVPPQRRPRSYAELSEPRWKDQVALVDPDTGGTGIYLARFAAAQPGLGLAWLTRLRANGARLFFQSGQLTEAVASGRRAVGLDRDVEVAEARRAGAPIECVFASDGLPLQFTAVAVNSRAPHPRAARLFADWLISAEGRRVVTQAGFLAPRGRRPQAVWPKAWVLDIESLKDAEVKAFAGRVSQALKGPSGGR
ncbi:MAG: extracellular solute-binding protein [Elusimicrobia bacterium]|nr:extracellular solute-binding protein [Elusimicrobiota bacterium]